MVRLFRKKVLTNSPISLSRNNLPWLVRYVTSNAVNKFERKTSGREAVRAGKGFTLFFTNEEMNDVIKIIKSLKASGLLIDGLTKTVNYKIKKQENGFAWVLLAPLAALLVEPVMS